MRESCVYCREILKLSACLVCVYDFYAPFLSLNHEPPSWMPTRTDEFFLFSFVSLQKKKGDDDVLVPR